MGAVSLPGRLSADELRLASHHRADGLWQTDLSVPGIRCGGCMRKIESALADLPGVTRARVNLSTKRVAVDWRTEDGPPPLGEALDKLGYEGFLYRTEEEARDPELTRLIRALAVAGFASMNIMGLSVSIWSGASGETRDLFHWLSAAIALPTLAYAGQVFFRSAWQALRRFQTNMDVPISIGVILAFAMSLYDTVQRQPHAYFDASVSLLFFLLIGRTLDHVMRDKARQAVTGLGRLAAYGATVLTPDGERTYMPAAELQPGMVILLCAGDRIPVDAMVVEGRSDIDASLATGEAMPEAVSPGSRLRAGTLNLSGPITIRAIAAVEDSFLAEILRLMEAAEGGRSQYRRIADRASALYAPVVHSAALLSFAGWILAGGGWHQAITIAVAVLIITCPCALGLAVPMVQVVAARALFDQGIMVKDGSAMERLVEIDRVAFDKTGTLTLGSPVLRQGADIDPGALAIAAQIGAGSRHPYARALAASAAPAGLELDRLTEQAGYGMEAYAGTDVWRLGRRSWALNGTEGESASGTILARNGILVQEFAFDDALRPGAAAALDKLRAEGLAIEILSGDRCDAVGHIADMLDVQAVQAQLLPSDKAEYLQALAQAGHKALMVGDGLNDAPALVAAHVSIAPGSAADVGRQAADFVFLRNDLAAVPYCIEIARKADRLIRQNFALAILYNAIALPAAVAGLVTPLIAALAMSGSSVLVVANALRLRRRAIGPAETAERARAIGAGRKP